MGGIQTPKKPLRRIAVVGLGWSLVIGGVIGLLLSVAPGGFLIILGVLVVATEDRWLRGAVDKLGARFSALKRALNRLSWRGDWRRPRYRISDSRNAQTRLEL
jgi:hypothetical protein